MIVRLTLIGVGILLSILIAFIGVYHKSILTIFLGGLIYDRSLNELSKL